MENSTKPTLTGEQMVALIAAYAKAFEISETQAVKDIAEVSGTVPSAIYRYRKDGIAPRAGRLTRLHLLRLASERGVIETAEHEAGVII